MKDYKNLKIRKPPTLHQVFDEVLAYATFVGFVVTVIGLLLHYNSYGVNHDTL